MAKNKITCLVMTPAFRQVYNELKQNDDFSGWTEKDFTAALSLYPHTYDINPDNIQKHYFTFINWWNKYLKENNIESKQNYSWARSSGNNYEVSSAGDKRFSALYATFKSGTKILGIDVSGMTIEDVYQKIIKKSGKGKAPASDSILNPLSEGIILDTKEELEDYSYQVGYLPLWQEWAKQNPKLIDELAEKSKGKILTDKFANTRVSQARALSDILNDTFKENPATSDIFDIEENNQPVKAQTTFSVSRSTSYPARTKENADWSDITLALAEDFSTAGERLTKRVAGDKYVSNDITEDVSKIIDNLYNQIKSKGRTSNIKLNIAGNGIYSLSKDQEYYNNLLVNILQGLIDKGVTFSAIRSGGQTGIDEAGIIAAQRLGIPSIVHTTSDYKFRGKDHKDISNEDAFKARFNQNSTIRETTQSVERKKESIVVPKVVSQEKIDEIKSTVKTSPFRNTQERRDTVIAIARDFSFVADRLFNQYKTNLENEANKGNTIAAESLNNLDRTKFITTHIAQILDALEQEYADSKVSIQNYRDRYIQQGKSPVEAAKLAIMRGTKLKAEFSKIRDNWMDLLSEVAPMLRITEKININLYNGEIDEQESRNSSLLGEDFDEDNNDGESAQEYKEGWMIKARKLDIRETLSEQVRKLLSELKLIDLNGNPQVNHLFRYRFVDQEYAHHILLNFISDKVNKPYELVDGLKKLSKHYKWVNQVIDAITPKDSDDAKTKKEKSNLKKKLWMDMNKEFNPYSIEYFKENPDGTITVKTKPVNLQANINFVLNSWRDAIESGYKMDPLSIYTENEEPDLNEKHLNERNNLIDKISKKFNTTRQTKDKTQAEVFFSDKQNVEDVYRLTKILGIEIPVDDMVVSLQEGGNLRRFLGATSIIFSGLKSIKSSTNENNEIVYNDLLNHFNTASKRIAFALNYIPSSAIMQTFRENGSSYQSYTAPSFKGKILKALKSNDLQVIEREFKQIYQFYDDVRGWKSDWLEKLVNDPKAREVLDWKTVLHSDRVDFDGWDKKKYALSMLIEFASDPERNTAWYTVPLMADVESADYIKFYRYKNEEVLDKMVDTVLQEYDRINIILKRQDIESTDPNAKKIAYYDITFKNDKVKGVTVDENGDEISREDGAEFKYFPELNRLKVTVGVDEKGNDIKISFKDRLDQMLSVDKPNMIEIRNFIKEQLRSIEEAEAERVFNEFIEAGIFETVTSKKDGIKYKYFPEVQYKPDHEILKRGVKNFVYNYGHAYTQITQLLTTDIAGVKNLNEYQKRAKQYHAMLQSVYYEKGETMKHLIIEDDVSTSNSVNEINEVIDNAVEMGYMSKEEAKSVKATISDTFETTDGQAFRSLKSFFKIMDSMGDLTIEMEEAYARLKDGNYSMSDMSIIFQTIKPLVYGTEIVDSHIAVDPNDPSKGTIKIRKPVQFKNSEAVLFTLFGPLSKSPKLRALSEFIEKNEIDVVQFASSGKVGNQGVINYNIERAKDEDYYDYLVEKTGLRDNDGKLTGELNPEVVHSMEMDTWGIVSSNPPHILDTQISFPTQMRKLNIADFAADDFFTVKGFDKLLSRDVFVRRYSEIIAAQAISGLQEIYPELTDIESLARLLQKELNSNTRYDESLKEACTLIDDGQGGKMFNLPLYDPIQSIRIQNLINSIIKRATVKQKIKGGTTTQVSAFGVSDKLNVRFLNKDGEFIFNEEEWDNPGTARQDLIKLLKRKKREYNSFAEYKATNKAVSEVYWEVYMPVWDKRIFEICNDGNGGLDISKLPEEMRYVPATRIPTEDKYSEQIFYVKDFLPSLTGSQVIVPKEMVLFVGADFDVDHNYDLMYDFYYNFNPKKAFNKILSIREKEMWKGKEPIMESALQELGLDDEDSTAPEIKWLRALYDNDRETYNEIINSKEFFSIKIPRANHNESYLGQNSKKLNNTLIDFTIAVLTHPKSASRMVNPGNFEENKRVMYLLECAKNMTQEEFDKEIGRLDADQSLLKSKAELYKGRPNPLSPLTQINFHIANSTGGKMISIYASNNASHALMQFTQLALEEPLILNDKEFTSLHDVTANDDKGNILFYISKQLAAFLGASVDNVKAPTLSALNQNQFTTAASVLMLRLGVSTQTLGLFLNQPSILEATKRYLNNVDRGKDAIAIIEEVMKDYANDYEMSDEEFALASRLSDIDLLRAIIFANGKNTNLSETELNRHKAFQLIVLERMKQAINLGDNLNRITQGLRGDTVNGSNGPDISDTMIKQDRIEDMQKAKGFIGIPTIYNYRVFITFDGDFKRLYEDAMQSEMPIVNAFTTAAIYGSEAILSKWFPHYNETIMNAYSLFRKRLKPSTILNKKIINKFYEHLFLYDLMAIDAMNVMTANGDILQGDEVRSYFFRKFPIDFRDFRLKSEELGSNEFAKRLFVHNGEGNRKDPDTRIEFRNIGSLTATLKSGFMHDWDQLLFSSDEKVVKMAINLFRYGLFRQGLSFGPNSFIHIATNNIRRIIPDYLDRVRSIIKRNDNYTLYVNQFLRNNLFNTQLCPVISPTSSFKFTKIDGKIKQEVILELTLNSSRVDKNIAISEGVRETEDGEFIYIVNPHPFISTNINGEVIFYRFEGQTSRGGSKWEGRYVKVNPLEGHEYEYGVDESLMETVVPEKVLKIKSSEKSKEENERSSKDKFMSGEESIVNNDTSAAKPVKEKKSDNNLKVYNPEVKEDATGKKPCR